MANVFISHRGADLRQAQALAEAIRAAHHDVWLDEWEISLGDSVVSRINEGLEGTAFLIMCLSDEGVTSPWMSREWMSALARQLEHHNVKILPVRLTGGSLPAIIADIKYADLSTEWDSGVMAILRALEP